MRFRELQRITRPLPKEIKEWIHSSYWDLRSESVVVDLQKKRKVAYEGDFSSGYFVELTAQTKKATLVCAVDLPWKVWFPVYLHEFCHFEQWRYAKDLWDSTQEGVEGALDCFKGKSKASKTEIIYYCMNSAAIEHDCEKRVLSKIKSWGFPIDMKAYAKAANAYITFYYAIPELRSWCNEESPYLVPEVLELMPDHLNLTHRDYWQLASKCLKLFKIHCVKSR